MSQNFWWVRSTAAIWDPPSSPSQKRTSQSIIPSEGLWDFKNHFPDTHQLHSPFIPPPRAPLPKPDFTESSSQPLSVRRRPSLIFFWSVRSIAWDIVCFYRSSHSIPNTTESGSIFVQGLFPIPFSREINLAFQQEDFSCSCQFQSQATSTFVIFPCPSCSIWGIWFIHCFCNNCVQIHFERVDFVHQRILAWPQCWVQCLRK